MANSGEWMPDDHVGKEEVSKFLGDMTLELLGFTVERPYYTFHDVQRAARSGVAEGLDFALEGPDRSEIPDERAKK